MNDNEIVDLFWQRVETAIDEASKKYAKYCYSISFRILYSNEDANECVNDTFFRAWNAIPPARPNCLSTFLGKITRNISLNRYEKMNAAKRGGGVVEMALSELEECVPSAMDVEQTVDETILTEIINSFLGTLPRQQRMIFVRRYWYLCTMSEIATDYGTTESNVRSILFRTRNKLKIYLQKEGITL